jgi:6-phosphogluconate dehydrogenase
MSKKADIGVVGLAVMGSNLARNFASRGYAVAVYNRTETVTKQFISEFGTDSFLAGFSLKEFVESLSRPRKIILMVKAGPGTDAVIDQIIPFLSDGDILIDGGNAWYKDTQRREKYCQQMGVHFLGVGISGGEEGALKGPSIMPGGNKAAWQQVAPMLEKIAAFADAPCTNYIGPDGAGHFVKMVHNGIEYADMQLIAESYQLLKDLSDLSEESLAEVFNSWNNGPLGSYLIEITAKIFTRKDEGGKYLVTQILDKAGQKGTGQWTAETALTLGVPVPTIASAVVSRSLSSMKDERLLASGLLAADIASSQITIDKQSLITKIHDALYAAKIISYAQGMALMSAASKEYKWSLNLSEIAALWKGGCIIRAKFLNEIASAFKKQPDLSNLMLSDYMRAELKHTIPALRYIVSIAALKGIPVLALSTALAYFDSYRSADLPLNLTQAQRDFFGAHTYERKDMPGVFHTQWE